jgi:actin-related protein
MKNGECWTKKDIASQAEEERKRKITEHKQREDEARKEAQRRVDEAKRTAQEADAKRKADAEAKRVAEETKKKAEADEKRKREDAAAQERLQKLQEQRKADELRAKEAEEQRKANEARRLALEAETKAKGEEEKRKQAEAKAAKPSIAQPEPKPAYTFKPTTYGTVEVFENGKRIATVAPSLATTQYGYQPGKALQPDLGSGNAMTTQAPKPSGQSGNTSTAQTPSANTTIGSTTVPAGKAQPIPRPTTDQLDQQFAAVRPLKSELLWDRLTKSTNLQSDGGQKTPVRAETAIVRASNSTSSLAKQFYAPSTFDTKAQQVDASRRADAAVIMQAGLIAKLPTEVASEGLKSAINTSLKSALSMAIPSGLSPDQQREAINNLTALWKTNLKAANFGSVAGGFATDAAKGFVVGKVADITSDFVASIVAKRTTNTFAIELARSSTKLAILDSYAAKGGWQAVLVQNGAEVTKASIGLAHDTYGAAKSVRAYELQVNAVIARAEQETDPAKRVQLLKAAQHALTTLDGLKQSHPVINTISNITVDGTLEELKSWMP